MVDPTADPKKDRIVALPRTDSRRRRGPEIAAAGAGAHRTGASKRRRANSSSQVANAVNKRFHTFQNGIKTGVAKADDDEYIELKVHPRYKDNIARYVQVVRAVPLTRVGARADEADRRAPEPIARSGDLGRGRASNSRRSARRAWTPC